MKHGEKIINIGILAHVDAGKTTLTEQILYKSGVIKSLGSVDKGTAHTDNLEIEQQRGISVKSTETNLTWNGSQINLIDTPGHVDFSSEVERTLSILDGAILVISAVEGVQAQTEVYFKVLETMKIPTIIFINKIDRVGSDIDSVLDEIKKVLTDSVIGLGVLKGDNFKTMKVGSLLEKEYRNSHHMENLIEALADKDDILLERYLEGKSIDPEFIKSRLCTLVGASSVYPLLYGIASKGIGIIQLLDLLVETVPSLSDYITDKLSAIVFKIRHDKELGKLTYIRLYCGKIHSRDSIYNYTKKKEEKITHIKKLTGQKEIDYRDARAGEIVSVTGLYDSSIGDILGNPIGLPISKKIAIPLLTVQAFPKNKADYIKMVQAFQVLEEEDPLLSVENIREKQELHIKIMGMIQIEVIGNTMENRFNIDVSFGNPTIIYKETPSGKGIGFEAYTMPKPCWAIVKFGIEPLSRGRGLIYESRVRTEDIKVRYQREVEAQLPKTLQQGLYGWEVIDLKVTLLEGEDHVMHSNPGDFHIATAIAIMNGLKEVGTTLLEPIISFRISVPEEVGGKVLNDIIQMRGSFKSPMIQNGSFTVEGEMPMSTSIDYPVKLGITSSGKGIMTSGFSGYKPLPIELGKKRQRIGVNPLDRAKYILDARNAIR